MTARRKIVTLVLGVALTTGFLIAQAPPGPPDPATMAQHRVKFLTTILSLSSAQQQQALAIFTNAGNSETNWHDSMKAAHEALDTAVKSNDSAGISQAATSIGDLSAQMITAHAKADAAFYQILTADQKTKYNELEPHGPMFSVAYGPGMMMKVVPPGHE
jgi:Spy/CpxP family protein refolding chaperone